ncbi:hypothetical protein IW140_003096 [Coemansia sp. RSA 1813]|nr:hypothetical protein EV178_003005 [Coemansia sp. RSA 1646]KAJ1769218.1 hypothetical protein LPJ74_004217 [Coemansia sp. RSA 1843]KAJ2089519.1 hypothetical protein IW138_003408 [Coemansia sp. RSA 986]KAJ2214511.1 hypothetical protein EV179_002916 [Coemansia sp. RSA 487]KAJ2569393.1 hypothetical protein IW140_003096 [Coemansia sp. RSA 1813]
MKEEIAQVEGCSFTTEELQQFHQYYKYPWETAELDDGAGINERIEYFVTQIDPAADSRRLREWLRTVGIVDASELSDEAQVYDRFENYGFAQAPGFNETLGAVYAAVGGADKHEIGVRMEQAKARYYNRHVEPLDYDAYQRYREANAPKPVCPYQHMWDSADSKRRTRAVDAKGFKHVKVVDLADFVGPGAELTASTLDRIRADVVRGRSDDTYHAVAVLSSDCVEGSDGSHAASAEPVFLPSLSRDAADIQRTMGAYVRLQIELRRLNQAKPVVLFASGRVDQSALGILLSTADVITTEMFSVAAGPQEESAQTFPVSSLYDWAHLGSQSRGGGGGGYQEGTAEYVLCNSDLVLRSSEWAALGLGMGVVAQRNMAASMERILLAASCPPPHTRDALRKAYMVESSYPGPSRIDVWTREIAQHFAPLADGSHSVDDLVAELESVQKPWASKYLAFATASPDSASIAALRVAALRTTRRGLQYSGALATELGATVAWSRGERGVKALLEAIDAASVAEAEAGNHASGPGAGSASNAPTAEEIPGECPFAQMYRRNPERFKNADLKAISGHSALDL